MSAFSRSKGARGELEVCEILRECGWPDARRTHDGREQALRGDIAHGPAGWHIECKRTEKTQVWAWWAQACADALPEQEAWEESRCVEVKEQGYREPLVVFRRSRSPWLALVEFETLLEVLRP